MLVVMVDVVVEAVTNSMTSRNTAAPKAIDSKVPKEALHHVEPRSTGGCEVNTKPRMALQPALDGGMFVSRVVVHDQMQLLVIGCGIVHEAQETKPFEMPVTLLAQADYFAIEGIESRE